VVYIFLVARVPPTPAKPQFHLHSLKLTPATATALEALAVSATDAVGRRVSGAACIRALITYAAKQGGRWVQNELTPFIVAEQQAGASWGRCGRRGH
jgi:hypothetical protein